MQWQVWIGRIREREHLSDADETEEPLLLGHNGIAPVVRSACSVRVCERRAYDSTSRSVEQCRRGNTMKPEFCVSLFSSWHSNQYDAVSTEAMRCSRNFWLAS